MQRPRSPENLWGSQYPGPLPPVDTRLQRHLGHLAVLFMAILSMAMVRQDAGYDLVTVTPTGIEARLWGAHASNIFEFYCVDVYTMCANVCHLYPFIQSLCVSMYFDG